MSRQLKFRAWVKSDKRMITDKQDFIPLIVTNKGVMKLQPQFETSYYEILPNEWFELMQYTGLKDKNGVEIYEGDIVEATRYDGLAVTGVVDFRDCSFVINTGYQAIYTWIDYQIEVIGSVWENQELLEESEDE